MIATPASPGQGTLLISPEKAPPGIMAVVIIRNRKTREGLKYANIRRVAAHDPRLEQIRSARPVDAVMAAEGLSKSEPAP